MSDFSMIFDSEKASEARQLAHQGKAEIIEAIHFDRLLPNIPPYANNTFTGKELERAYLAVKFTNLGAYVKFTNLTKDDKVIIRQRGNEVHRVQSVTSDHPTNSAKLTNGTLINSRWLAKIDESRGKNI
jgi:hypothetical protein